MVNIQQQEGAVKFVFEDNVLYLRDGSISYPLNTLAMVIDESDIITFKLPNGDVAVSFNVNDAGISKAEMEQLYAEAFVGSTGGGGVTPEEMQTAIDTALAPVNEDITALSNEMAVKEEVTARALTDLHENKQDKLTAGSGITISGNVISAEGGSSVTVDPTLDSGSTNPVANSAITQAINAKADAASAVTKFGVVQTSEGSVVQYATADYPLGYRNIFILGSINGTRLINANKNFSLVETSAVTTSMTSSSTDAQVPSAKAVFDAIEQQQQNYYTKSDIDNASNAVAQALIELQERLGGLTLVKLTQAAYDALSVKDSNTLYIISNVVNS